MSGIGNGPPRLDGTRYDNMRQQIEESQKGRDGQHVRGSDDGTVYLHEGMSRLFGGEDERKAKQAQGAQNVFEALSEKVGEKYAEVLFREVGRERGGRDLKQEFKISDFDRIEEHRSEDRDRFIGRHNERYQGSVRVTRGEDGKYVQYFPPDEENNNNNNNL